MERAGATPKQEGWGDTKKPRCPEVESIDGDAARHSVDVDPRLGEDASGVVRPGLDDARAGVVGHQGIVAIAEPIEQVAKVPRSESEVENGIGEQLDVEVDDAKLGRDPCSGLGHDLHQSDGTSRGDGLSLEAALAPHDRRDECRIEPVLVGEADDVGSVGDRIESAKPEKACVDGEKAEKYRSDPSSPRCESSHGLLSYAESSIIRAGVNPRAASEVR